MAVGKNSTRVTITMTKTTLARIDRYAKSLGITRAAAVSVLCSSMLNSIDLTNALTEKEKTVMPHVENV